MRLANLVNRTLRLARMTTEDTILRTDVHRDSAENEEKKCIFGLDSRNGRIAGNERKRLSLRPVG